MANKFGRYVWLIEQFRQYGRDEMYNFAKNLMAYYEPTSEA